MIPTSPLRPAANAVAGFLVAAVVVTLPWIGMGVVRLLAGVDTGAGFQPAYLLLVPALALVLGADAGAAGRLRPGRPAFLWLAAAVAALALSALALVRTPGMIAPGDAWMRYLKQILQIIVMAGFVALPLAWFASAGRWVGLCRWLGWGLLFQAAYGALQALPFNHPQGWFAALEGLFTSNPSILSGSEELYLGGGFVGIPRLRGTACEPLYLGSYLLMALPWLVLAARRSRVARAALAAGVVLLAATWSRGAWLAGGAGLGAGLLLLRRARIDGGGGWSPKARLLAVAGVVAVLAAVALILGADALLLPLRRLVQSLDRQDWSNLTRLYSMQAAWRAFLLSPLIGVGWGQFAFHFPALVDPVGLQSQFAWPVVNNFPLQVLCETGLVGLGVLLAGVVALARRTWRKAARGEPESRLRAAAAGAAAVGVGVQLLTFSQYNLPHIWLALGLLLAATRGEGEVDDA